MHTFHHSFRYCTIPFYSEMLGNYFYSIEGHYCCRIETVLTLLFIDLIVLYHLSDGKSSNKEWPGWNVFLTMLWAFLAQQALWRWSSERKGNLTILWAVLMTCWRACFWAAVQLLNHTIHWPLFGSHWLSWLLCTWRIVPP